MFPTGGSCGYCIDSHVEVEGAIIECPMNAGRQKRKSHVVPKPGRKLGFRDALERTNRKFTKALAKLAK